MLNQLSIMTLPLVHAKQIFGLTNKTRQLIFSCSLFLVGCGGGGGSSPVADTPPAPAPISPQCSRDDIGSELSTLLATVNTDTDFALYVENSLGNAYSFNRGSATLETPYDSASTSKWVTAAAILRLVENGRLQLSDTPQTYLSSAQWPINSNDSLSNITLSHLLSFTSGLINSDVCNNLPNISFSDCIIRIANQNAGNNEIPGENFYYGGNHLQVAGAMAIAAGGYADWQDLFDEFKVQTGLFSNSTYNLPSTLNPRLAGGMTWTGNDYIDFIRSYKNAYFFSSTQMVETATSDQIANATIGHSPASTATGEEWHYGYGLWIECHMATFDSSACTPSKSVSSPGAYGAYPFLNLEKDYFGIIARQGELGSFNKGYELYNSVRNKVDDWATCPNI